MRPEVFLLVHMLTSLYATTQRSVPVLGQTGQLVLSDGGYSVSLVAREPFFGVVPPTITHRKRRRLKPSVKGSPQGDGGTLCVEFTEYRQLDLMLQ